MTASAHHPRRPRRRRWGGLRSAEAEAAAMGLDAAQCPGGEKAERVEPGHRYSGEQGGHLDHRCQNKNGWVSILRYQHHYVPSLSRQLTLRLRSGPEQMTIANASSRTSVLMQSFSLYRFVVSWGPSSGGRCLRYCRAMHASPPRRAAAALCLNR